MKKGLYQLAGVGLLGLVDRCIDLGFSGSVAGALARPRPNSPVKLTSFYLPGLLRAVLPITAMIDGC